MLKKYLTLTFLFVSSVAYAQDYTMINLKYITDYNMKDSYVDGFGSYIEIETIAQRGDFNFYGFTDLRYMNHSSGKLNYDFYKYILKYDVSNSKELLFVNIQAKETYSFANDMFLGVGSHIDIPVFGRLYANVYYFLNYADHKNNSSKYDSILPMSLAFNWFNIIAKDVIKGWDLAHGGWSDIDFYTNIGGYSNSRTSVQIYEGISLQHNDYALETGYKYWIMDTKSNVSHSLYLTLIKKF